MNFTPVSTSFPSTSTLVNGQAGTVLVVDDCVENLNLISEILTRASYKVLPALSGNLALKALNGMTPDLVLLDVRMPEMNGYEVCRHLKANEHTRDIPVIFISANHDLTDRMDAFDAGGVDYVTKPFCEEEILARVRAHVQLYRGRRDLESIVAQRTQALQDSEAHLRQLSIFLQRVREDDRAHFARELHDELGQSLTALRIDFLGLENALTSSEPAVLTRLGAIHHLIASTIEATRRICEDLRPGMLDDLGLEAALASYARRFARQYGVACDLALDREDFGLDEAKSTAIFRIVQESLTNIAKHACAKHAIVALQDRAEDLLLTIADDGCGMPAGLSDERKTFGLLGMRERVQMLGGSLMIDSAGGRGTHIEVSIPKERQILS